jgi:integrase
MSGRICSRRAPSGLRNAALIAALRHGEALALRPHDIDLDNAGPSNTAREKSAG